MNEELEKLPLWETVSVVQGTTGISTPTPTVGDQSVLQGPTKVNEMGVDLCSGRQEVDLCLSREGLD
jgi:hypothetical protein